MTRPLPHFFQRDSTDTVTRGFSRLPIDLRRKARRRVQTVAWLMLITMTVGAVIDLAYAWFVVGAWHPAWTLASVVTILSSLGVILAGRRSATSDVTVLRLGLAYEIVLCFALAIFTPWLMFLETGDVPYVTWVTPIIIFFPLIIPSPPVVTVLTATAAALTRPLALLLLIVFADLNISGSRVVMSTLSPAFAVVFAYVGSRIVYGMTQDLTVARKMGSYRLESLLGRGGMGEVWLARHQFLARPAAVKFIRPETIASRPEQQHVVLARFQREAQATAALTSPHTIRLYDFGVTDSGSFYYAMELLDGLDLDELVRQFGPVSPGRTVNILTQICDSLGEAHDRGLIHRDVKPANVYICRMGRRCDFAKVLDFGLVKLKQDETAEDFQLTEAGGIRGTPNFIAPEQAVGGEIDGRADIYALGCVAYWLLTGFTVFEGRTVVETMMMHVEATPTAPSSRSDQDISPELDDLVLTCLSKDPGDRPKNINEVLDLLANCRTNKWTQDDADEWWTRNRPRRDELTIGLSNPRRRD